MSSGAAVGKLVVRGVDVDGLRRAESVAERPLAPLEAVQLDLFETDRRRRAAKVAEAMDRIRGKMGKEAVLRASLLDPRGGGGAPRSEEAR